MPRKKTTGVGARTSTGDLAARDGHTGRPSKLTERTADAVIHAVLSGNHLTTAAAMAGISPATIHRWMRTADDVEEAIDGNKHVDPSALPYLEFRNRLNDARAQAEARAVQIVQKQMLGGYVTHEKPLQDANGDVMYNSNTGELIVERTVAPPDGRLALSYLSRSRPGGWSLSSKSHTEVTGAGGGAVQVEHSVTGDVISGLAERIAQVQQRDALERAERAAEGEGDDDVIDADVVEESDHEESA